MKELRDTIIKSLLRHAEGHIEKHCANIEVYLTNPVGVGEHPDIVAECDKLLSDIADADGKLQTLSQLLPKNVEESK